MKVHPSNQTLILASEWRSPAKSGNPLDQAISAASSGGALKRVTIVASQQDSSLLYLQADYAAGDSDTTLQTGMPDKTAATKTVGTDASKLSAPQGSVAASRVLAVLPAHEARVARYADSRDEYGNLRGNTSDVGLSSYLSPAEQYAQTQRIETAASRPTYIDVMA